MNIRLKRLQADYFKMQELQNNSNFISFEAIGNPPERYIVRFSCKGLAKINEKPSVTTFHKCEIYLHNEYPRKPPLLKWLSNIYHPNILSPDKNGGVCIGGWSPSESLDQLCLRIAEMVQYKNYSLKDALDKEAAEWARGYIANFPVDNRELLKVINMEKIVIEDL